MKIVAIGLSHNEADVVQECVQDALGWVDAFILYDNSTDGTADLAREAGAIVLPGDLNEQFDNGLRQHTLVYAAKIGADWIARIDPDEFYPRGAHFNGDAPQDPRAFLEYADKSGYQALRGQVLQFWITLGIDTSLALVFFFLTGLCATVGKAQSNEKGKQSKD